MLALRLARCSCSHTRRIAFRLYSSANTIPPLPPPSDWKTAFPINNTTRRERAVVNNPATARLVARSFLSEAQSDNGGKIVIEAFPGPGALSRALLELPPSQVRKLIILEDDKQFLDALKPLEAADPRVTIVPMSGHSWDTYSYLEEHGLLEGLQPQPWEGPSPNLHFVAHLPVSMKGEQLLAQLFRCIPERSWLFQHGRVPLSLLMTEYVWQRLTAPPRNARRCKLAVIAEATADIRQAVDPGVFVPYSSHFHPTPSSHSSHKVAQRRVGQPMHALTAIPYAEQVIQRGDTDKWDFCLRRLFVLKNTPLKDALNSLAPGATSLLKDLQSTQVPLKERVSPTRTPRSMTLADWTLLLRAFNNWPFRPEDLMISDAFKDEET
ncbi:S-adenosyl-L-methionine-dependent methyltransferase [Trametes polyzona]|nr:S-adenosyl-L-methionine-dependent methyltransferase [Trametes polyzona]